MDWSGQRLANVIPRPINDTGVMTMKTPAPRPFLSTTTRAATIALAAASALAMTWSGPHAAHRARLSADLTRHLARVTKARARVIVSGSDQDVDAIAAR